MTRANDEASRFTPSSRTLLSLCIHGLAICMVYVHCDVTATGSAPQSQLVAAGFVPPAPPAISDISALLRAAAIGQSEQNHPDYSGVPEGMQYEVDLADESAEAEGFDDSGFEDGDAFEDDGVEEEWLDGEEGFVDGDGFSDDSGFEDEGFEDIGFIDDEDFEEQGFDEEDSTGVPMQTASLSKLDRPSSDRVTQRTSGNPDVLEGRAALLMNLKLLETGYVRLGKTPSYTATFFKQERLGDELGDGQVIEVKLRHAPFSVYMRWMVGDRGREVLYIDGENNGDMIAHPGGWKGRMLPAIKLNPRGSIAMSESRHPVTHIGLRELARHGIEICKHNLKHVDTLSCFLLAHQAFDNRPCYLVVLEHSSRTASPEYRKLVVYIDHKLSVPVAVRNYGWSKDTQSDLTAEQLDQATLIENYAYSDIQIRPRLAAVDFDQNNKSYKFRR